MNAWCGVFDVALTQGCVARGYCCVTVKQKGEELVFSGKLMCFVVLFSSHIRPSLTPGMNTCHGYVVVDVVTSGQLHIYMSAHIWKQNASPRASRVTTCDRISLPLLQALTSFSFANTKCIVVFNRRQTAICAVYLGN